MVNFCCRWPFQTEHLLSVTSVKTSDTSTRMAKQGRTWVNSTSPPPLLLKI